MVQAAIAGVLPPDFWAMTFRELSAVMQASRARDQRAYELAISQAWHAAAFARARKLPRLDRILALARPRKPMSGKQLRDYFIQLNEQMGGRVIDRRKKKD